MLSALRERKGRIMEISEQAKEARRAYQRAWRAANKDKIRKQNIRYWEKKAAAPGERHEQNKNS